MAPAEFFSHFAAYYWIGNIFQKCKELKNVNNTNWQSKAIQIEEMVAWRWREFLFHFSAYFWTVNNFNICR